MLAHRTKPLTQLPPTHPGLCQWKACQAPLRQPAHHGSGQRGSSLACAAGCICTYAAPQLHPQAACQHQKQATAEHSTHSANNDEVGQFIPEGSGTPAMMLTSWLAKLLSELTCTVTAQHSKACNRLQSCHYTGFSTLGTGVLSSMPHIGTFRQCD